MSQYLGPLEYAERIEAAVAAGDDRQVWRTIQNLDSMRDARLLEVAADGYTVPTTAAIMLYRSPRFRREPRVARMMISACGWPNRKEFWNRVAQIACEACDFRDDQLLGRLAWHVEICGRRADWEFASGVRRQFGGTNATLSRLPPIASPVPVDEHPQEPVENVTLSQIQLAFDAVLDPSRGRTSTLRYVRAALAYFHCIPSDFVFPPELLEHAGAPGARQNWRFLHTFWQNNLGYWQLVPEAMQHVRRSPHPRLQVLASRITATESFRPPYTDGGIEPPLVLGLFESLAQPRFAWQPEKWSIRRLLGGRKSRRVGRGS